MGSSMANLCRLLIPLLLPLLIWGNSPTSEKERQKEKTNTKSEVAEVDEKDASEASTPPEESNPNTKTNTKSEAPLPPQDSSPSSDYQTNRRRRKKDTWNVDCERRFTHGAPCTTQIYTAGTNFARPPVVTVATNINSVLG